MRLQDATEKLATLDIKDLIKSEAKNKLTAWLISLIEPLIKRIIAKVLERIFQ